MVDAAVKEFADDFGFDRPAGSRRRATILVAFALTALVAAADYLTGYEVRLSILYLLPVALATWAGGLAAGVLLAAASALAWGLMFRASHTYSGQAFFYWEAALNIVTLVLFAWLFVRAANRSAERQELIELADERGLELDPARAERAVAAGQGERLRERILGGRT